MKLLYNLLIKNILGKMPTVLVSSGKIEDKTPRELLTQILARAL